jgi:DNA replication protein DnaC
MHTKTISTHDVAVAHVYDSSGLRIEPRPDKRSRWEARLAQTWGHGTRGEWSVDLGCCKGCGCEIDTAPAVGTFAGHEIAFPSTVCEDCMTLVREHYDPQRREQTEATATPKWDQQCGERHKQVVMGEVRPAQIDWANYERVSGWLPEQGRGFILTGPPGCGKTSAYWALARNLELAGHAPIMLSSLELGRVLGEAGRDIRDVGWLYRCRVLMVDDLGKERASPGVASLLWEVMDKRLAKNLPVFLTTNFTGAELAARFGESHLGDAIRRRISELCRHVRFNKQEAKAA